MKTVYLMFAVVGAIIPYVFFVQHFSINGLALPIFMTEMFATPVASGAAADLFISSFVFWVYLFSRLGRGPSPWPFIAINLLIGLSCALPAYLFWVARSESRVGSA